MIVFSHVPRTGGTSVRRFVIDRLPADASHSQIDSFAQLASMKDDELGALDFLATHCGFAVLRRLPRPLVRVVVLREPVSRVISMYDHLRAAPTDVSYASAFAKSMTLQEFVQCNNPAVSDFVRNTQTWQVFADKSSFFRKRNSRLSEAEILAQAIENLHSFEIVGVTPELDRTFGDLADVLGTDATPPFPRLNQSLCVEPARTIAQPVLDIIAERVQLDARLYEVAEKIVRSKPTRLRPE
jgi:hypothetical protein